MPAACSVKVCSETEVPQGWRYVVEVSRPEGPASSHRVRLGWVDHNHWAGERPVAPSRVIKAMLECLLESDPARALPDRFDAATARRWDDRLDERMAAHL